MCMRLWGGVVGHREWLRWCAWSPDVLGWWLTLDGESHREDLWNELMDGGDGGKE